MIIVFVVDTSPSMGKPLLSAAAMQKEKRKQNAISSGNNTHSTVMMGGGTGMSRLDLAKMAVESLAKGLDKRVQQHNVQEWSTPPQQQQQMYNIGLGGHCPPDQFLLLSTGRQKSPQHVDTAACGAGGRLLVGYGDSHDPHHPGYDPSKHNNSNNASSSSSSPDEQQVNIQRTHGSFERELKQLRPTQWSPSSSSSSSAAAATAAPNNFPEDGGGAAGLNAALSSGLQLLSRYRLKNRSTENFGMGRLPSSAMVPSSSSLSSAGVSFSNTNASLQRACLVLITDGECLTTSPAEGGGSLQLQFGNMPLREFYQEPFRWDQRIFCLRVGSPKTSSSSGSDGQYLHPSLRAFCEVTGGGYALVKSTASLSHVTDMLLRQIAPPRPKQIPIPDPLRLIMPSSSESSTRKNLVETTGLFVHGGPVCSFQQLEVGPNGESSPIYRAMILYAPYQHADLTDHTASSSTTTPTSCVFQPPIWCIPETFFPSKKFDTLPPRLAQPLLNFSRQYQRIGSSTFDPMIVMQALNRLDQVLLAISRISLESAAGSVQQQQQQQQQNTPVRFLQRDVYVCEWVGQDGKGSSVGPKSQRGQEHSPVCVRGAARSGMSEGDENFLNIGILHLPCNRSGRLPTITLLPPEPHMLIPLLVRAAEAELRHMKKSSDIIDAIATGATGKGGATAGLIKKQASSMSGSRSVALDDNWRNDFRAYLFRIPPYYQHSLRRCLRPVLPSSVHSLLSNDGIETIASQCFSRLCLQKIRSGEQLVKEKTERLERQEEELRRRGIQHEETPPETPSVSKTRPGTLESSQDEVSAPNTIGYGQYDPRSSNSSYLAALRNMPPPWRTGNNALHPKKNKDNDTLPNDKTTRNAITPDVKETKKTVMDTLGDLPADCSLAYYESRRRWIFGGSGLTTRGLAVEGVNNDGGNSHYYSANHTFGDESLLAVAGLGATMFNETPIGRMGEFRERLLWSRAPVVGYGTNDSLGSASTTTADGSTSWSVDNDALPMSFFDPKTGEFVDTIQSRMRSRLMINFGNPFKDKRGDSLIPESYLHQRPPLQQGAFDDDAGRRTPPSSPPNDAFSSPVEGEGEAAFAGYRPLSPTRSEPSRASLKRDSSGLSSIPTLISRSKRKKKRSPSDAVTDSEFESKPTIFNEDIEPRVPEKEAKSGEERRELPSTPPPPPKSAQSKRNQGLAQPRSLNKPPAPPHRQIDPGEAPTSPLVPPQKEAISKHRKQPPPPPFPLDLRAPSRRPLIKSSQPVASRKQKPPPPPAPGLAEKINLGQQRVVLTKKGPPPPPPPPLKESATSPQQQQRHQIQPPPPPEALDLTTPGTKPNVDLPQGWMSVWSKSQKRWYFFDTKSNKSVWEWPPPGGVIN